MIAVPADTCHQDITVAIVALAAGASRRFGPADKLLCEIDGEPLVARVIRRLNSLPDAVRESVHVAFSGVTVRLIAVVPDLDGPVGTIIARIAPAAALVANPRRDLGLGTSVAAGIAAVPAEACGALVTPCDLPDLDPSFVAALLIAFRDGGCDRPVHAALSDGTPVSPMVWPRRLFGGLLALNSDAGGRQLLHRERPIALQIPSRQTIDIDTEADLASYRVPHTT